MTTDTTEPEAASAFPERTGNVAMDDGYGEIQVVMTPGIQAPFREWLSSRGLYLFPIPVGDDLPTYGIGVG